jgi:hypothetical protein
MSLIRKCVFFKASQNVLLFYKGGIKILAATVCFTDLDQGRVMIILESVMNTFKQTLVLEATRVVAKISLSLKSNQNK